MNLDKRFLKKQEKNFKTILLFAVGVVKQKLKRAKVVNTIEIFLSKKKLEKKTLDKLNLYDIIQLSKR